ncbi:MAG TPA: glycosyltransferase family 2 protein [Chthoniobacterales bacterium]|jgi:glycosyltransferase involved in cell wall biosynthesis
MSTPLKYVLITPARDEAQHIEGTIQSVIKQTVRPLKWVIVSDGSTDGTDDIVRKYTLDNPWIELVRTPERRERHFAGKVHAFNAGYARLNELEYAAIGNLDADISFDEDYFSFLLGKLLDDPKLGLVGTPFRDASSAVYDYRFTNIDHVSGACQLFRRECFEAVGGYVPVKGGCIDHIAVLTARMKGWKTRTFTEKVSMHHRAMGTAQQGMLLARFRNGGKDYAIGNHPAWELFRAVYQMTKRPFIIGGLMIVSGYGWAAVRRAERPVSPELVAFQRREQIERLKRFFTGSGRPSGKREQDPSRYA